MVDAAMGGANRVRTADAVRDTRAGRGFALRTARNDDLRARRIDCKKCSIDDDDVIVRVRSSPILVQFVAILLCSTI